MIEKDCVIAACLCEQKFISLIAGVKNVVWRTDTTGSQYFLCNVCSLFLMWFRCFFQRFEKGRVGYLQGTCTGKS